MSKQKRDSFKIIKLVLIGLIIGFLSPILFRFINLPTDFLKLTIEQATFIQLGAVLIIYIPTIICIRKANQHFNRIDETVDDENDWHSKKGSKRLFQARLLNRLFIILSFMALGIAIDFNLPELSPYHVISLVIFIGSVYLAVKNDIKIVRIIQSYNPMKKGDPLSFRFNKEYYSSMDEAEKNQIYRASFHTYLFMENTLFILLVLSICGKIYFRFGNGPIYIIGLIWLIQSSAYFYNSKKYSKSQTFV